MYKLDLRNLKHLFTKSHFEAGNVPAGKSGRVISLKIISIKTRNLYTALAGKQKILLESAHSLVPGQTYTGRLREVKGRYLFQRLMEAQMDVEEMLPRMLTPLASADRVVLSQQIQFFLRTIMQLKGLKSGRNLGDDSLPVDGEKHPPEILNLENPRQLRNRVLSKISDRDHPAYVVNHTGQNPHWVYIPLASDDEGYGIELFFLVDTQSSRIARARLAVGPPGRAMLFAFRAAHDDEIRWNMTITVEDDTEYEMVKGNLVDLQQKLRNLGVKIDDTVNRQADDEDISVYAGEKKVRR